MNLEESKEEKKKINIKELLKKNIVKEILTNIIYALLIVIYFICFNTQCITLETSVLIQYINISSLTFLAIGIVILEFAFNKNKKKIGIYGIEFLILAITTLLIRHIPKIMECDMTKYTETVIYFFIMYYILKSIIIYTKKKHDELKSLSDIKEIVKEEPRRKESKRKNKKVEEGNKND